MIKFYFHHTPNPMKVALFLEESGLPYEAVALDVFKGDQHDPEYRKINPNGKAPAIEDDGKRVFDSNAILLYLAEKSGQFMGKPEDRGEFYSWLMWVATGLGPYSGQWVHFQTAGAAEGGDYAKNRYKFEAHRHYEVMEAHLEGREFFVSGEYTIVDMAAWGWVDRHARVLGEGEIDKYPNVKKWFDAINARPAVERARTIATGLEFKATFDEETARAMFPSNFAKA
ncbi:glutathione S-transferase family protein [Rhodobacteraceae bacterium NNCM2]|nr:glutathione S-transferase family protein [Coraliihabitans acroporae]